MYRRKLFLFILTASITIILQAQVNSPYSRYGIGNIFPSTFGAANGMGGISAAYFTPTNINYLNPAAYAELTNATFDVSVSGTVNKLETNTETFTSGDGNLAYMAFGFPFLKKIRKSDFGLSFGLIPYSGFRYNIYEQVPTDDPVLGTIEYNYAGDGTLYQIYGGVGYKFQTDTTIDVKKIKGELDTIISAHQFSIGTNAADLFGTISNFTYASFPDQVNAQTTKLSRDNRVNGGIYNAGIGYQRQYVRKYGTDRDILVWKFGASGNPGIDVNGKQSVLWTNIVKNGNYEYITDTLYTAPDTSGTIGLPSSFQAGVAFSFYSTDDEDKNQFTIGAQYARTNWSTYHGFQDAGTLGDSWRATLSLELIPKLPADRNASYALRLGAYTGKSNLIIDGVQLNDYGVALGAAIPLGYGEQVVPYFRSSRMNVFLNIGQRGSTDVIKETYFNFGLGFSLVDAGWFIKYKLN